MLPKATILLIKAREVKIFQTHMMELIARQSILKTNQCNPTWPSLFTWKKKKVAVAPRHITWYRAGFNGLHHLAEALIISDSDRPYMWVIKF